MNASFRSATLANEQEIERINEINKKIFLQEASINQYTTATDLNEKETYSQYTKNLVTISLIEDNPIEQPKPNELINKKRTRPTDSKEMGHYYRNLQKIKVESLENEKSILSKQIEKIESLSIASQFNLIPDSLREYKDIISPDESFVNSYDGCKEYIDYLTCQLDT